MQHLVEFSDSEVGQIEQIGGELRLRFSAACVVRVETPSQPVHGYAQSVELVVFGARRTEAPSGLIGRVAQGRIAVAGRWATRLALPCRIDEPIRLELSFANHGTLNVTGDGVECRFMGEPNFSESLAC